MNTCLTQLPLFFPSNRTIKGFIMNFSKGILCAASTFLITNGAFAGGIEIIEPVEVVAAGPYWEFLAMGGIASLVMNDVTLDLTSIEVDELHQTHKDEWRAWTANLGFGYVIPFFDISRPNDAQWFTAIEPQINAYYLQGSMKGDFDRFVNFPGIFNDTDYSLRVESARLMFDTSLTFLTLRNLSFFGIAGIGPSWNRVTLDAYETDCLMELDIERHTSTNLAYEFGGGLIFTASENLAFTAEYLYTGFRNVKLGDEVDIGVLNKSL